MMESVFSAWGRAWEDWYDLSIQASPFLLRIYGEEKRVIPDLDVRLGKAWAKVDAIWGEFLSLVDAEVSDDFEIVQESSSATSASSPSPTPDGVVTDSLELLRQRVKKGREYLQREYWGKPDRDKALDAHAKVWCDLVMDLFEKAKARR